ncbi:hypothetical protein [Candidatus Methanocrinis natronophilus]|uniref:Uncharacterized protein n=1 Tax=Candidatus Methanocrinis natronophilus TaxID=3033396 RepID=A0ABT5X4Q8_9EURY|nr:hypothetical protein [Candidatus Methanocrinis natronophilus]MDF0589681.1 hypothetical protein [Candidatus Methanocrinis natronophilus]
MWGTIRSKLINITLYQAILVPRGTFNESVTVGDKVKVYRAYFEDEIGCIVPLQGTENYYFELAAEEKTEVVDEEET